MNTDSGEYRVRDRLAACYIRQGVAFPDKSYAHCECKMSIVNHYRQLVKNKQTDNKSEYDQGEDNYSNGLVNSCDKKQYYAEDHNWQKNHYREDARLCIFFDWHDNTNAISKYSS